jgi:CheY-like chemotaxis protein
MDISMPIMGGIEATQKIRMWEKQNNLPAIPIIAATANVGIENIESYRAIGMFGFVPKPFKRVELIEEISRALQG